MLAHAYGIHWKEAAKQLRSKEFDTWLYRGLSDSDLVEVLEDIITSSAGSEGDVGDAKLTTRVCSAMDPEGPLKYKGLTVMPDGMGYALSAAVEAGDKDTINLVTELIQKGIASDWFEQKIVLARSDLTLESKAFKTLQQFVRHSGPGYGVERVLYELNPFLPCRRWTSSLRKRARSENWSIAISLRSSQAGSRGRSIISLPRLSTVPAYPLVQKSP
jgi:hypothetical protein